MWIHDLLKPKDWDGKERPYMYIQQKFDGHRMAMFKQSDGSVKAFGRKVRDDLELLQKYPRLLDHPLVQEFQKQAPKLSSVDCEVYVPEGSVSEVKTALIDASKPLDIKVFAVPFWGGKDFSRLLPTYSYQHIPEPYCVETLKLATDKQSESELLAWAIEAEYEGYVLKQNNYANWWKVKVTHTVDCLVTDVIDGKGRNLGLIGSLECSVYDPDGNLNVIGNVGCGLTDEMRFGFIGDDPVGKIAEIEYQSIGANGKIIHGRFIRFRDDKCERECTL